MQINERICSLFSFYVQKYHTSVLLVRWSSYFSTHHHG